MKKNLVKWSIFLMVMIINSVLLPKKNDYVSSHLLNDLDDSVDEVEELNDSIDESEDDFQQSMIEEEDKDYSFKEVEDQEELEAKRQKIYFLYLKAGYLHARGKVDAAIQAYQSLLELRPPEHIYGGYLALLFDIAQFQKIIQLAETPGSPLKKILDENLDLQLIVAQSYINLNHDNKASDLLEVLSKKNPDNVQIAYFASIALLKSGQNDRANKFIDECLSNQLLQSKHFLFLFLKSKIYLAKNNLAQALFYIEKSLELFPKFDRGWLLKGMLLEQQGKVNEAISGYKSFLDLVGSDIMVEKQLIQLLFSQKRFTEAADYLKKIKNGSPEYFFDLALIQYKGADFAAAYSNVKKALHLNSTFEQARLLMVDILFAMKNFDRLLSFIRKWIEQDPRDETALHTLLILHKGPVGSLRVIELLESIIKDKKHSSSVIITLGDLYAETGNYYRAIYCYEQLVQMSTSNQVKANLLYHLGYLYNQTKQINKVEIALNQAIELEPSFASAKNLLAYCYAENEHKLEIALDLIEQALSVDSNSSYFLDTKGYILLKLGRKEEAVRVLEKARSLNPNDLTIQQHLSLAVNGGL